MSVAVTVLGLSLVAVALLDQGWTTVAAGSGAGPLTRRLGRGLWRIFLGIHRRRHSHSFLGTAGPVIIFVVFGTWVATVLVGWALVFLASDGAVRDAQTGLPGDVADRLYFTGYTVFTLGIGDYRPGDGIWQLVTVVASGTGLVLVTLGITYLIPVASAVTQRRQMAASIAVLGDDGTDIVVAAWNGQDFGALPDQLLSLGSVLQASRQRHLTYPVVHYFHSVDPETAAPVQLAHLALALDALRLGVAPGARPDPTILDPLHRSVGSFLETLATAYIEPADEPLEPIPLARLTAAGIPTTTEDDYRLQLDDTVDRRRLLAGLLRDEGWPVSVSSARAA